MAEAEREAVEIEIFIEAPPATVFEFFIDPQLMPMWMGGHARLEPLAGGTFAVDIGANHARGQFLEVVPTEKVVFTWGWEGSETVPPGSSTVTVTFESAGAGATMVRLIHQGLPAGEDLRHRHGWTLYLSRLTQAAAGLDPGPDPHPQVGTPLHETS